MKSIIAIDNSIRVRRDEYIDCLKFYLMCFVILGHTLMEHLGKSAVIDGLHYWIYTFHMPLFVYISGYFSNKMERGKYRLFLIRTFETFFLFQAICVLLKYITGEVITWEVIISPQSVYWYLFSIIIWRSCLQFLPEKWLKHTFLVIVLTFVFGLISGFVPISNELSVQRSFSFLPFFVLGYYSKQYGWLDFLRSIPLVIVMVLSAVSLLVFFSLLHNGEFTINRVYDNMPYDSGIYDVLIRGILWLLAVCNSITLIRLSKPIRFASIMGTKTLYFYVYHHFLVNIIVLFAGMLSFPTTLLTCFLESLLVIIICCILVRIPFFRLVINPITSLIKHK